MRKPLFAVAGLVLIASGAFASAATVSGADHRDSPLSQANPTADILDVYAFRSPANSSNLVVVFSVNPLIAPSDNLTRGVFDPAVKFQIHIDRNGDLIDDATIDFRLTNNPLAFIVEHPGPPFVVPITPANAAAPVITEVSGIKLFAGLRDDPFFFDIAAFGAFVANPQVPARGLRPASAGSPVDALAGTNVLAIVMELPVAAVTGGTSSTSGTIKAWVSSTRNGARIDRDAIPALGQLIPSAQKEAFNAADPINDATAFRATAASTITTLRGAVDAVFGIKAPALGGPLGDVSAANLAAALVPDVVTIDFSKPVQFPNGRRLQDDVIDVALGLILNRGGAAGVSDGIDANDKAFLSSFPYLAEPHLPVAPAPAAPAVRPPATGSGGLLDDTRTLWSLSAALFIASVGLAGAGVFAAMRSRSR